LHVDLVFIFPARAYPVPLHIALPQPPPFSQVLPEGRGQRQGQDFVCQAIRDPEETLVPLCDIGETSLRQFSTRKWLIAAGTRLALPFGNNRPVSCGRRGEWMASMTERANGVGRVEQSPTAGFAQGRLQGERQRRLHGNLGVDRLQPVGLGSAPSQGTMRRSARDLLAVLLAGGAIASTLWRVAQDDSLTLATNARAALSADYRVAGRRPLLDAVSGAGIASAQATPGS